MKYCNNCGSQMEDESVFCANCGATNEAVTPSNDFSAKAKELGNKGANFFKNIGGAVMNNKKLLIIPAIAIVVIVAAIVVFSLLFKHPYKDALKNYIAVEISHQASEKQYEEAVPKDAWEYYEDEYNQDFDEQWEYYEESAEYIQEALEDKYGDYKVTYKIKESKKLSDNKLEDYAEELEDMWDIDDKDVKKGYKVKLEVTIKGDDDKDSDTVKAVVVKYDGEWYVIDMETPKFYTKALSRYDG